MILGAVVHWCRDPLAPGLSSPSGRRRLPGWLAGDTGEVVGWETEELRSRFLFRFWKAGLLLQLHSSLVPFPSQNVAAKVKAQNRHNTLLREDRCLQSVESILRTFRTCRQGCGPEV